MSNQTIDEDEVFAQQKPEDKDKKVSYEIGYIVPFWSSKPIHKYSLEVWREGAIINQIDIGKKEYYLVGRNKLLCDVYINNLTVSRVHCVLQHKDDGELYIYDMDSVYGTQINKKQIAKKVYTKLNVGDTFKLGQSGKMFIVNGPAELLPEEDERPMSFVDKKELIKKRAEQVKEQYEQRENYKRNLLGLDRPEADWGQRDFDEEIRRIQKEEEDSDKEKEFDYYGPLKIEEIKARKDLSEKQKSLVEKLENTQKTITKLKDEIIKIQKKEFESGEITEGQKKRVEINEKKLENLLEKYELIEDNLRTSLQSKDNMGYAEQKFDKKLLKEMNSDEDEFYDRAKYAKYPSAGDGKDKGKEKAEKRVEVVTENYETLKSKLEMQMRQRQKLVDKLQKFDAENKLKDMSTGEEIDALDAYFIETQKKISSEQKSHLTLQITDLNKEIAKTQKLISLATPSHIKIKFKTDEELMREKQSSLQNIQNSLAEREKERQRASLNPEDEEESNALGIKRDQDALDKEHRKKAKKNFSVFDVVNKMNEKIKIESTKKFTDSDEEILDEVKQFKENLGREIEGEMKQKAEEFRKIALKNISSEATDKDAFLANKPGGLITNTNKTNFLSSADNKQAEKVEKKSGTLFEEIIGNIGQGEFDIDKYKEINKVLTRKNEEKWDKRNQTAEIDYSKGGLQTFEKKGKKEFGLLLNSETGQNDTEEAYFDEEEENELKHLEGDVYADSLLSRKRDREANANPYLEFAPTKKKVYGAPQKPKSRNVDEEDLDENDYEAFHMPQDKYKIEHDINKPNPLKREYED